MDLMSSKEPLLDSGMPSSGSEVLKSGILAYRVLGNANPGTLLPKPASLKNAKPSLCP